MLRNVSIFGFSAFYSLFNVLGGFAGLIVMIIIISKRSKELYADKKGLNRRFDRLKTVSSTIISFAVSYIFLYTGTSLIGDIKFHNMEYTSVAYIGGVLLFIPTFMFLAYHLPKNGDVLSQLELTMPTLSIMQFFNRLSCISSGCCYGIAFKYGVLFPKGAPAILKYGIGARVFPTTHIESAMMLFCFILTLVLMKKGKQVLHIFPILFGTTGFIMQFLTGDLRGIMIFGVLDVMQIGYLILIAFGVSVYFFRKHMAQAKTAKKKSANTKKPVRLKT